MATSTPPLYWRHKKNGKWTWSPALVTYFSKDCEYVEVESFEITQRKKEDES